MTQLSMVTRLFRTDPNKGQIPRDPLLLEKATPQELLKLAKQKIKDRRPLSRGSADTCAQILKLLCCKAFCCCRDTRFSKVVNQGRGTIRRELDLFHFLKNQRQFEATLNALTTYDQRRLIKQQVRAGLLVAPI